MKVGINGFGKVGQALLQRLASTEEIAIVAINEIGTSVEQAVALLGSPTASINTETVSGEHGDDHRVRLKLYYDPAVSYAERIREQLLFLAIHRRPVSTGPSP